MPILYHYGEWVQYGITSDIKFLYDIQPPKELYFFYLTRDSAGKTNLFLPPHRYAPEHYILFMACKRKVSQFHFAGYMEYNSENIFLSKKTCLEQFYHSKS